MNELFDVLLGRPMPDWLLRTTLFTLFSVHLLFVLFTIGTAVLAVYYFIQSRWHDRPEEFDWAKRILRTFLAHKSLAVVIGLGALLLIQVTFTVPFFTATNLIAPFWLSIIVLLIASFLALDAFGQDMAQSPRAHLMWGSLGLLFLLAVPAIFVVALTLTETPGAWLSAVENGYRLPDWLSVHVLLRYAHILGAAIVFGAAFHYFITSRARENERLSLLRWMLGGLLFQIAVGVVLYASLPDDPPFIALVALVVGIVAALVLLWVIALKRPLVLSSAGVILLVVLLGMLLTRQALQDKTLLPFNDGLRAQSSRYEETLASHEEAALTRYQADLDVAYDNGPVIYEGSCSFCHGVGAGGDGPEATSLLTPPEAVADVRTTRDYLRSRLVEGIDGTGMPYFRWYTRDKLDALIDHLDAHYDVLGRPTAVTANVSADARLKAETVYGGQCATCHGADGADRTRFSAGFAPAPPDLTLYTLNAPRAFQVISEGYRGTMMVAFDEYPEEVRWGLVEVVHDLYAPQKQ